MGAVISCGCQPPASLNFVSELLHVFMCLLCSFHLFLLLFFIFLYSGFRGAWRVSLLCSHIQFFPAVVGSSHEGRLFCPQPPECPGTCVQLKCVHHNQNLQAFLLPFLSEPLLSCASGDLPLLPSGF